jgi:hypothetical protein
MKGTALMVTERCSSVGSMKWPTGVSLLGKLEPFRLNVILPRHHAMPTRAMPGRRLRALRLPTATMHRDLCMISSQQDTALEHDTMMETVTAAAKATPETSRAGCGATSEAVTDEGQRWASMALEMIDCRSQHGAV